MSDLISRQAAIDVLRMDISIIPYAKAREYVREAIETIYNRLEELPSAQPEIIRCKDCRWWDKSEDSQFGYCMAMKHGYISANWEIGIYRRYKGDWYCADAKRRTDE